MSVAASAVGALLVELCVRLFAGPIFTHTTAIGQSLHFDPELGHRELPDFEAASRDAEGPFTLRLDANGFRGRSLPEPSTPKPAGVERIAFLGDSFLVAWAVRDADLMTARTERTLRERGWRAEVYSLAASDYGTAQELLLLRRHVEDLDPDAVVLAMYPANDLANNAPELAGRTHVSPADAVRPYLVPDGQGGLAPYHAHPIRAALRRISRTFALLERNLLARAERRDFPWLEPPKPLSPSERARRREPPLEAQEIFRQHSPEHRWERAWDTTFALLRALREEAQAQQARLLVLVIPSLEQVQRDAATVRLDVGFRNASGKGLDDLLDWNLPEQRLAPWLAQEGIDSRLLLGPLREAVGRGVPVYSRDAHLNARGHAIAAALVSDWYLRAEPGTQTPPEDAPVRLLPPPEAARDRLDFRSAPHVEYLAGGFLWRRSGAGGDPGWITGRRAVLVLPARAGDLVVRGEALPDLPIPLEAILEIEGGRSRTFRIGAHGPFALRLERPLGRAPADRYVVVELEVRGLRRVGHLLPGLLVHAIGFEREVDPS